MFDSPLLLYTTGSHFQAVFQHNHEYFISYALLLEDQQNFPSENSNSFSDYMNPTVNLPEEPRKVIRKEHQSKQSKINISVKSASLIKEKDMSKQSGKQRKDSISKVQNQPPKQSLIKLANKFECLATENVPKIDISKDKEIFEEIKKIKPQKRTILQKKTYERLRKRFARDNMSEEAKQKEKDSNKTAHSKARENLTEEERRKVRD